MTSPLRRAGQTAAIVAKTCQKSLTLLKDLQEHNLGVWEGKLKNKDLYNRLLQGETFDSVESVARFDQRIEDALTQVFALPGPILIISHGGVWSSLCRWMKRPYNESIKNCALFHCTPSPVPHESWIVKELRPPKVTPE